MVMRMVSARMVSSRSRSLDGGAVALETEHTAFKAWFNLYVFLFFVFILVPIVVLLMSLFFGLILAAVRASLPRLTVCPHGTGVPVHSSRAAATSPRPPPPAPRAPRPALNKQWGYL